MTKQELQDYFNGYGNPEAQREYHQEVACKIARDRAWNMPNAPVMSSEDMTLLYLAARYEPLSSFTRIFLPMVKRYDLAAVHAANVGEVQPVAGMDKLNIGGRKDAAEDARSGTSV